MKISKLDKPASMRTVQTDFLEGNSRDATAIAISDVSAGIVMAGDNAPKTRSGAKTQTRRVEKCLRDCSDMLTDCLRKRRHEGGFLFVLSGIGLREVFEPKYQPGQILYIQEALERVGTDDGRHFAIYKSDKLPVFSGATRLRGKIHRPWQRDDGTPWKPRVLSGRYMPKTAARTFIRITDVRCERLKDISIDDIVAEGLRIDLSPTLNVTANPKAKLRRQWRELWNKCNPKNQWQPEMWNFAYEYELVEVQR